MLNNPYERDIIKNCAICGTIVFTDKYGNGKCTHCGWVQNNDEEYFERKTKISYPNLVPLSRAREQYKQGKPFKATFEDFVNGLYFYSEMIFWHNDKVYEVFLNVDKKVIFCCKYFQQEYSTRNEFIEKANINGRLLKNIWDEIEKPGFMCCGGEY